MTTAFVWSGGSIKIAWEAGVNRCLLRLGIIPDAMYGTSAGAILTGYHAAFQPADPKDWPAVGDAFADFLIRTLTGPDAVARKRGLIDLAWRYLRHDWDGVVDTAPLAALVHDTFRGKFPATGPLRARVCAVNLRTGDAEYFGSERADFADAVLASAAEPVTMPARKIGADLYQDGGLADIAPLAPAIQDGADRIICVVCQPEHLPASDGPWGDLGTLLGRDTSIVSTTIVNDDIRTCRDVNAKVAAGQAPGKRHIDLTVIRPATILPIALESFTSADIARMVAQGDADAARVLVPTASEPGLSAA